MLVPKHLEQHFLWTDCGDPVEINAWIAKCREDPTTMWLDLELLLELKEHLEKARSKMAQGFKVAHTLSKKGDYKNAADVLEVLKEESN